MENWVHQILGPLECPECGEREGLRIMSMSRVARTGGDLSRLSGAERAFADRDPRMDFSNGGGIIHLSGECLHDFDIALSLHDNRLYVANLIAGAARCDEAECADEKDLVDSRLPFGKDEDSAGLTEKEPHGPSPVSQKGQHSAKPAQAPIAPRSSKGFKDFSDSEKAEICAAYVEGSMSVKDIKDAYGIGSVSALYKILSAQGVAPSRSSQEKGASTNSAGAKPAGNGNPTREKGSRKEKAAGEKPVSSLPLVSKGLVTKLGDAGIETVGDLCVYSADDLVQYGIGRGSLITLTSALEKVGMALADSE